MSAQPPWIKPAISFGVPLLAVVIALPYLTGHPYSVPGLAEARRWWAGAAGKVSAVAHGVRSGATGSTVRLYECRGPSGKVLSSSPCGPNARVHDIDPESVSRMGPAPPPPAVRSPAASAPLGGVRGQLDAAQAVDARNRAAAEADAQ